MGISVYKRWWGRVGQGNMDRIKCVRVGTVIQ